MAALTGPLVMGLSSVGGGIAQSQALKAQGKYAQRVGEINAANAERAADDSIKRGDKAAENARRDVKRVVADQRTATAAQGVEVDSGTAGDIMDETLEIGEAEARTIKSNAWREAWGFKQQAINATTEGKIASIAAENNARATLLTGGMNAIGTVANGIRTKKKE
jgi:hypothetical protein